MSQTAQKTSGRLKNHSLLLASVLVTPLLLLLSIPPFNLWPLAFVALVPPFLLMQNDSIPRSKVFWAVTAAGSLYWVIMWHEVFATSPGDRLVMPVLTAWIAAVVLITILAIIQGLCWGIFSLFARRVLLTSRLSWLAIPMVWIAFEIVRSFVYWQITPGIVLGYSLPAGSVFGQVASLGGVWLVSGLLVLANWLLALAISGRLRATWIGLIIVLIVWGGTGFIVHSSILSSKKSDHIEAIAIQSSRKDSHDMADPMRYEKLIMEAQAGEVTTNQPPARLIILPEATYAIDKKNQSKIATHPSQLVYQDLPTFAVASMQKLFPRAVMVAGFNDTSTDGHWTNGALVASRTEPYGATYKRQLFPFGEYLPLANLWPDKFRKSFQYQLTTDHPLLVSDIGRIGIVFCNELYTPFLTAQDAQNGATVIAGIASNFDVSTSWYASWQGAAAAYRAVETSRSLILAADQGQSAIILPNGTVQKRAQYRTDEFIKAEVPLHTNLTPWSRWSTLLVLTDLILGILAIVLVILPKKQGLL